MAINPSDITTVSVPELPPAPLSDTSELAHSVGDILSKCSGLDLKNYLRSLVGYAQYEIRQLLVPAGYIAENFDTSATAANGLGLAGKLWEGWAILNGNNGTANLDGKVLMAYGATRSTVGEFLGSATHTLSVSELPPHNFRNGIANDNDNLWVYGGTSTDMPGSATAEVRDEGGSKTKQGITNTLGGGQSHNNIQPSVVVLTIIKL